MSLSSIRPIFRTVFLSCAMAWLCACGFGNGGTGCGEGYASRYRDVVRDTAIVVAGQTVFVQVDRWVSGEFMSFDSSATAVADIASKETSGLGDTLRFRTVFREMYYDQPNDSIPTRRYLRVSNDPDSATSTRIGFARTWNCGEARGAAARELSPFDGGSGAACSVVAPNHRVARVVVEFEPGRSVVVGF